MASQQQQQAKPKKPSECKICKQNGKPGVMVFFHKVAGQWLLTNAGSAGEDLDLAHRHMKQCRNNCGVLGYYDPDQNAFIDAETGENHGPICPNIEHDDNETPPGPNGEPMAAQLGQQQAIQQNRPIPKPEEDSGSVVQRERIPSKEETIEVNNVITQLSNQITQYTIDLSNAFVEIGKKIDSIEKFQADIAEIIKAQSTKTATELLEAKKRDDELLAKRAEEQQSPEPDYIDTKPEPEPERIGDVQ